MHHFTSWRASYQLIVSLINLRKNDYFFILKLVSQEREKVGMYQHFVEVNLGIGA